MCSRAIAEYSYDDWRKVQALLGPKSVALDTCYGTR